MICNCLRYRTAVLTHLNNKGRKGERGKYRNKECMHKQHENTHYSGTKKLYTDLIFHFNNETRNVATFSKENFLKHVK